MAESKRIKGSDLIAPGFLTDSIEQAQLFLNVITETKKVIVETNKVTSKKLKEAAKGSSSKDLKDANNLMTESIKQRKLAAAAIIAEDKASLDLLKAKKALADFAKKGAAEAEKERKATEAQNSAYGKASARLNQLRKEYKDLAISGKGADKATQDMLKTIQQLDKDLKKVDADVGQFNRSVGDYKNQVKEALAETDLFSEGMNKLGAQQSQIIAGFSGIINQLKALKAGQDEATAGASKLGRTLKAIGIVALIAALASVFAFFTSSREGALQFDLMLNKLKATVDILIGSFAKLGKGIVLQVKSWGLSFDAFMAKSDAWFSLGAKRKAAFAQADKLSAEADKLAVEASKEFSTAFEGNTAAIVEQSKAYDELTKKIFKYEDQIRVLSLAKTKAEMEEQDFNEIAADTTRGLNEQIKALEDSIEQRAIAARIGVAIAEKEMDIAISQAELKLRTNKVSEAEIKLLREKGIAAFFASKNTVKLSDTELDALQEKFVALDAAKDNEEDLERQEGERRRKIVEERAIANIELIRSKKLGADIEVKILKDQINDEKFQLEERINFEETLRAKQLEARAEEMKEFKVFGLEEAEIIDLINEKDAVRLANKLKLLGETRLSKGVTDELAKVVLEQQTNDLDYQGQLAKFEDERIKREEKILKLNREIAIIVEQSVLDEVARLEQEKQKILDESNAAVLEANNVFNKKLLAQRQKAADETTVLFQQENEIKKSLLLQQYVIDEENIFKSIDDEKIRDKELEKLRATYLSNITKLESEANSRDDDFSDKELALLKAIEIKKTEIVVDALQKATAALTSELDKRNSLQDKKASEQIEKTESQIDRQKDLAARGLANTLAFQEAQLAKQQLQQADAARKQAKQKEQIALAEALLNAYNSELKQPNSNPTTAAAKALADVLLFKGLAAGLVQFAAEGNDRVQGPGTRTSDSIPFMLSKDEGVVKADANMGNPGVVAALNADVFDKMYMPKYNLNENIQGTAQNIASSVLLQSNKEVINLLTEIKNKPIQHIDVDKLGNLIEIVHKNGIKTVTKYKNKRSIG